jgi:hypothetical protein
MKTSSLAFVCLSLISGTAFANPMAIIMRLSAEVTGSTHVQLRYLTNYGSAPSLSTYGTSHSDWFTTGDTTSEDTGSGVKTMTYQYMCDCHVPTGSALSYKVESSASFSPNFPAQLSATVTPSPSATTLCDEKCAQADSRDAGMDAGGTTATGGSTAASASTATGGSSATGGSTATDPSTATAASKAAGGTTAGSTSAVASTTSSAGGSSGSDVSTVAAGGSSATAVSTGNPSEEKKGGACSFSSNGRDGALSLLLALGLVALSLRRRR